MEKRIIVLLFVTLCIVMSGCSYKNECICTCSCEDCTCKKGDKKEEKQKQEEPPVLTQEEMKTYVEKQNYQGALRQEGVIIGSIADDLSTMKVFHKGGIWEVEYVDGFQKDEAKWVIVADNETPDDYTDDVFLNFIQE